MRLKISLAYFITIILILIASSTLFIGFYLNIDTLRNTIEARETDKAMSIYNAIKDKIDGEIKELVAISQIMKRNPQLLEGLIYYQEHDDVGPLKKAMDTLNLPLVQTNVDFFLVTDNKGNIMYQTSTQFNGGDAFWVWGMEEALAGKQRLSAGRSPLGWTILTLTPLVDGSKQYGVLILGIPLNDAFARNIAQATHTQISFCSAYQILATSWPTEKPRQVNFARVTDSILKKHALFFVDNQTNYSSFYIPIKIVDETPCLVINADTTPIHNLLQQKRRQLFLSFLAVLTVMLGIGSGLTYIMVRPLRQLQQRAIDVMNDFPQENAPVTRGGNEITTLSQAMELMLTTIQKHLTQLRQSEESLQKGKLFLDSVVASIQDGLTIMDRGLTILRVNSAVEQRIPHFMPLVGQKCYAAFHGNTQPCELCPCRQAMETGTIAQQLKHYKKGKTTIWVEVFAYPLKDLDTGQVTGVIEYTRDVTERKAAEDALCQQEEQLRQAAKMEAVGRLAGGVAHDFNNILTTILGDCELLLLNLNELDPIRQTIVDILQAGRRAASLTEHLLAFSRKQVLQPQALDLNSVVANMDKILRRILGEDVDLVTSLAPKLGTVKVDPVQLEQVILNLAVNARDAMPEGGKLTLETANADLDEDYARRHLETQPGPYVMLAVSDTGAGLDGATKANIFEPFYTTKEMGQGTGLGLSMVYGIVKQSHGHIWVYSEPGQGTTFKIYLPRYNQPPVECVEVLPLREISTSGSETILLVEDEEPVRRVVSRLLERSGYRVLATANGPEALRLSQQHQGTIHLLFTDVVMPGMNGRELADQLRAQHPQLKVLFMFGYTENAIIHHGVLDPGIAFINKPFRQENLANKVREVLDAELDTQVTPSS